MRYSEAALALTDIFGDMLEFIGMDRAKAERFLVSAVNLPRPIGDWLVHQQLRNGPEVEKLWR